MWLVAVVIALVAIIYTQFKWRYQFWKKLNVPYPEPSAPFGNFSNVFTKPETNGVQIERFYKQFKAKNEKHAGFYITMEPVYLPIDTNIIKQILTKDHHHFVEKGFYINERDQPISGHLFSIGGEKWKTLRQKLTPTFTSGKMRMMFETVEKCRLPMLENLKKLAADKTPVDVKDVAGKFTTDIIGSVAFGLECNSFNDPDSEFRKHGKGVFDVNMWRLSKAVFAFSFKDIARALHVTLIQKDAEAFFNRIVRETINYRESNNVIRNDVMQLLINLMNKGDVDGKEGSAKGKITFDEVVAQAFVFFIAGFETSSTTTTFVMLELAQHQDIQDKVRKEIHDVLKKYDGNITYDSLAEMVYLKQVIDEALRKYPPLSTVDRKCTTDYPIPGTNVTLPAGTTVMVPVLGLQRDPEYYPDPMKFDPDRFSKENAHNLKEFTYMPFGEGPRMCIGLRFGIMQTKVGLITLLKDFRYTLNHKTDPNVQFEPAFILAVKGDVYLDVEAIKS